MSIVLKTFFRTMEQYDTHEQEIMPMTSSVEISSFLKEILSPQAQEILHFFMHGMMTGRVNKRGYAIFEVSAKDFFQAFPQYSTCTDGEYIQLQEALEELVHIFVEYYAYNHEGKRQLWGFDHLIGGAGYDMSEDTIAMELRFESITEVLQELEQFAGFEMTLQKKIGEARRPGGRKYEPVYKKVCIKEYTGPRYVYVRGQKAAQKLLEAKKDEVFGSVQQVHE